MGWAQNQQHGKLETSCHENEANLSCVKASHCFSRPGNFLQRLAKLSIFSVILAILDTTSDHGTYHDEKSHEIKLSAAPVQKIGVNKFP